MALPHRDPQAAHLQTGKCERQERLAFSKTGVWHLLGIGHRLPFSAFDPVPAQKMLPWLKPALSEGWRRHLPVRLTLVHFGGGCCLPRPSANLEVRQSFSEGALSESGMAAPVSQSGSSKHVFFAIPSATTVSTPSGRRWSQWALIEGW